MAKKISVLIIDDSPLIQELLTQLLNQASDIEVLGCADDPYEGRDKIKLLNPDVLTLDIEMPKMNGLTFLKNIMRLHPMPVVMISTLTEKGAPATLEALSLGAIDYVAKPKANVIQEMNAYAELLHQKIRTAAQANPRPLLTSAKKMTQNLNTDAIKFKQRHIVAIGASTGGTEAIKRVLTQFPAHFAPVVVTQHIPPVFSASFASRMDSTCAMKVQEARHNQPIEAGCVYIAPGDAHLSVVNRQGRLYCEILDTEPVNRHKPSVDVLFNSVAEAAGKHATGVLLTGMGGDGAQGLLKLRETGARTFAQDKQSCVVYGMPKAAVEIGAVEESMALQKIPEAVMKTVIKSKN